MDRFSDGGLDFYLGYLRGEVNGTRPMELKLDRSCPGCRRAYDPAMFDAAVAQLRGAAR